MAARPDPAPTGRASGPRSPSPAASPSGPWKALEASTWKVDPLGPGGEPAGRRRPDVRFRGGRVTYLSDLQPSKVEEIPFFGRKFPWRRDVNLLGEPLKMGGRPYRTRHRCALAVGPDLRPQRPVRHLRGSGRLRRLLAGQGRVDCRVFADDKEI